MADKELVEHAVELIFDSIGEDKNRDGLKDTPKRVTKMFKEKFRGYDKSQIPKVTTFSNGDDGLVYNQMITDEGSFYSHCEHHMVPFFGKYYFGYIPNEKGQVLGLSKVARVVDYFSAKLQVQERLVKEIVDYLWNELSKDDNPPIGMGLYMKGEHLCKSMRGVKKKGVMRSTELRGAFLNDTAVRSEFLRFVE